jgi:hypothetical protein
MSDTRPRSFSPNPLCHTSAPPIQLISETRSSTKAGETILTVWGQCNRKCGIALSRFRFEEDSPPATSQCPVWDYIVNQSTVATWWVWPTTSEMRDLSPKIISRDSRRSENVQTHIIKHTILNMKFKLKLLHIKCHVLGFTKDKSQSASKDNQSFCGNVRLSR